MLALQNKKPLILPGKWINSRTAEELQLGTGKLWQTGGKSGELRRRVCFPRRKKGAGRGCSAEFGWWWLLIGWVCSFSLAGLLMGIEKVFLPLIRIHKISFFQLVYVMYASYTELKWMRVPLAGIPDSVLNEASFTYFHKWHQNSKITF